MLSSIRRNLSCRFGRLLAPVAVIAAGLAYTSIAQAEGASQMSAPELSDAEVENIVRRSYQYVAMYNVNNKGALDPANPMAAGGWNRIKANTTLADHRMQAIARPNNDTLYVAAMLDLTAEPMVLESPAIDSKYVSLMVTGYDHYVNIPMSTRLGDFSEPSRILFYSDRTPGYAGEPVKGVDEIHLASGDFVSAIYRVMPHANEPERMRRNIEAMQHIRIIPLSDLRSETVSANPGQSQFPDFGRTDFDIFEDNLLEVMQFVFNHTSFDPNDEIDRDVLAAFAPLGVAPGREFDPARVAAIDGARFRAVAERIASAELAKSNDPSFVEKHVTQLFRPKGEMTLERLLFQSVIGPIGLPAEEAVYPAIGTTDGEPMHASNDYVIRMTADQMPPAKAFWSVTLYDTENGFFMPNDLKKYSVGENTGMALDSDGGIAIHLAAEQPEGVPAENWLPVKRGDYDMDVVMRIYVPDLELFAAWTSPRAEKLSD